MRPYIIIFLILQTILATGQNTHLDSSRYANGQLRSRGLLYEVGINIWEWGMWEYWYESGQKKLELWSDSVKTHYCNMWLPDGRQVLKKGDGYYFTIENDLPYQLDSFVYQIQDSVKNGDVKRYRSYNHGSYFLVETGHFENKHETGIWYFKDTTLKIIRLRTYEYGKQNGVEINYFFNGQIQDSINYSDDIQNGNYKAYSEKGLLIKDCNYRDGKLNGDYREYHINGQLKVQGQYTQGKGTINDTVLRFDVDGNSKRVIQLKPVSNKPLKQGVWKYYNDRGKLIKTKKYYVDKKV